MIFYTQDVQLLLMEKHNYESVLNNPVRISNISHFFAIALYTTYGLPEKKLGTKMVYIPLYNYETYGNKAAWAK